MMILTVVGIIGCHPSIDAMPAFTGFTDRLAPTGTSLGYLFPHFRYHRLRHNLRLPLPRWLRHDRKTAQQRARRTPNAYGGMLIESALAIISLCAVAYIWKDYAAGTTVVPTAVFAGGLSAMLGQLFGAGAQASPTPLLILAVSAFCPTSLDTATRLAATCSRNSGSSPARISRLLTGARKVLVNPYVATLITVVPRRLHSVAG